MENYNSNKRVDFLIELFQAGTLTPEQHEELLDLLAMSENADKADLFLNQVWENTPSDAHFFSLEESDRIRRSLPEQNSDAPVVRKLNLKFIGIASAAAVLLVFGYFLLTRTDSFKTPVNFNQASVQMNDLGPGGNRATLRLSDNRLIALDEIKNGVLIKQGNLTVSKTDQGQLVFQVSNNNDISQPGANSGYNVLTTPPGGQYQVVLPDGSHVWLNAASSLKFPSVFTGNQRKVELTGEGYFEISKVKGKTFVVNSKTMQVEVLGTHFNINAYPDEQISLATLVEGAVKITSGRNSKILVPNEQAQVSGGMLKVEKVDTQDALAWKEGLFVFDNEDIRAIMTKLSRWYNIKVEYQNPDINEQFAATISKFKNLSEVLKVLEATGTIHFKVLPSKDDVYERRVVVMK